MEDMVEVNITGGDSYHVQPQDWETRDFKKDDDDDDDVKLNTPSELCFTLSKSLCNSMVYNY